MARFISRAPYGHRRQNPDVPRAYGRLHRYNRRDDVPAQVLAFSIAPTLLVPAVDPLDPYTFTPSFDVEDPAEQTLDRYLIGFIPTTPGDTIPVDNIDGVENITITADPGNTSGVTTSGTAEFYDGRNRPDDGGNAALTLILTVEVITGSTGGDLTTAEIRVTNNINDEVLERSVVGSGGPTNLLWDVVIVFDNGGSGDLVLGDRWELDVSQAYTTPTVETSIDRTLDSKADYDLVANELDYSLEYEIVCTRGGDASDTPFGRAEITIRSWYVRNTANGGAPIEDVVERTIPYVDGAFIPIRPGMDQGCVITDGGNGLAIGWGFTSPLRLDIDYTDSTVYSAHFYVDPASDPAPANTEEYSLFGRARDPDGNVTDSDPFTVTVEGIVIPPLP